jgi:hypothetical protein
MDINMNNATFYKGDDGDNWIYLKVDGGDDIKVFYDDETYTLTKKKIEDYYSEYLAEINRENKVRAFDNAGQVMDFATTLAQTYGDKYSWS